MNLPRFSVHRPIFTTMVTLIVVILGAVSLWRLRIDLLPNVELPTVTVRTQYEGASPEVMERLVTQILEEIVATTNDLSPGLVAIIGKKKVLSDEPTPLAIEDLEQLHVYRNTTVRNVSLVLGFALFLGIVAAMSYPPAE